MPSEWCDSALMHKYDSVLCTEGEEFVRHDIIHRTDRLQVLGSLCTVCYAEEKQSKSSSFCFAEEPNVLQFQGGGPAWNNKAESSTQALKCVRLKVLSPQ